MNSSPIRNGSLFLALLLAVLAACAERAPGPQEPAGEEAAPRLGTVEFPVSCAEAARPHMETGLAQLHNMMYEKAEAAFRKAAEADADCALAYWGQAMTRIHPLWSDPPSGEELAEMTALLAQAREHGTKTDRESAYIEALASYIETQAEHETPRLAAFAAGWRAVHERFPDDPEAAALYALSHMATAPPEDKTYRIQEEAGAIAEKVLARIPDHPGAHHYIIHAYDYPPLAERALEVARSYGTIAPDEAHPLHMPSHIFTRLGLWEESIDWNIRSAAAAREHDHAMAGRMHHIHALDYLVYAYLQSARDGRAREVLGALETIEGAIPSHTAAGYALAAIPGRWALERQQWAEAAAIEPNRPDSYDWSNAPEFEANSQFARGIGAARSGQPEKARAAWTRLGELHDRIGDTGPRAYWKNQIAIQRKSVEAWTLLAEGNKDGAVKAMKDAAAMEAATEKHPVTPGEILPASELLGDMLLATGSPAEALAAYRAALERSPRRFRSLYGAGKAAEASGETEAAAGYFRELLEVASGADTERPELAEAKAFVEAPAG